MSRRASSKPSKRSTHRSGGTSSQHSPSSGTMIPYRWTRTTTAADSAPFVRYGGMNQYYASVTSAAAIPRVGGGPNSPLFKRPMEPVIRLLHDPSRYATSLKDVPRTVLLKAAHTRVEYQLALAFIEGLRIGYKFLFQTMASQAAELSFEAPSLASNDSARLLQSRFLALWVAQRAIDDTSCGIDMRPADMVNRPMEDQLMTHDMRLYTYGAATADQVASVPLYENGPYTVKLGEYKAAVESAKTSATAKQPEWKDYVSGLTGKQVCDKWWGYRALTLMSATVNDPAIQSLRTDYAKYLLDIALVLVQALTNAELPLERRLSTSLMDQVQQKVRMDRSPVRVQEAQIMQMITMFAVNHGRVFYTGAFVIGKDGTSLLDKFKDVMCPEFRMLMARNAL